MLVLTRREKDTIRIPDLDIEIEVCRIKGNTVRIGIKAPEEIRVIRGEISPDNGPTRNPQGLGGNCEVPTPPLASYLESSKRNSTTVVRESRMKYEVSSALIEVCLIQTPSRIAG